MAGRHNGEEVAKEVPTLVVNRKRVNKTAAMVRPVSNGAALPQRDMVALYQRIRASTPTPHGLVLEIIGAHHGVGATSVAYGIGRAAADLAGHRVLLCDGTGNGDLLALSAVVPRNSLRDVATPRGMAGTASIRSCPLGKGGLSPEMPVNMSGYAESLNSLRNAFDLIVIDVPPSNDSALGPVLARHADAVLIVVEAQKTRIPAISSLIGNIEGNGGRVTGVVMNKRRQHIPGWIYRWL